MRVSKSHYCHSWILSPKPFPLSREPEAMPSILGTRTPKLYSSHKGGRLGILLWFRRIPYSIHLRGTLKVASLNPKPSTLKTPNKDSDTVKPFVSPVYPWGRENSERYCSKFLSSHAVGSFCGNFPPFNEVYPQWFLP